MARTFVLPTHHLIAVHLPKLTACALVAPVAGVANTAANRRRPGTMYAIQNLDMMQPMRTRELSTRSHVTSQITPDAVIP
jgi:hypothetical protein